MNVRAKKAFGIAAAVVLAVVLLAVFLRRAGDFGKVVVALKTAFGHPFFLLSGMGLFGVSLTCGLTRWYLLLRELGIPIRYGQALRLYATGHFFNVLGPGATGGDLVKAAWFAKNCSGLRAESITSIAVERTIGFFAMFVLTTAITFLRADFFDSAPFLRVLRVVLRFACAGSFALTVVFACCGREPATGTMAERRGFRAILRRVWTALHVCFSHPVAALGAFLLSLTNHITDLCCYFLLSRSIGMTLPLRDLLAVSPLANTVAAVPITPGGAGLRENTLQLLLDLFGVARDQSTALALLMLGTILLWAVIGGIIMLAGPSLRLDREGANR